MPKAMSDHQKQVILNQALVNLNYRDKSEFSRSELVKIQAEINSVFLCGGEVDDFIGEGMKCTQDKLESLDCVVGFERYRIMARNLSRYLIRGVPLCVNDGDSIRQSPLYQAEIIDSLLKQRDPNLLLAWRQEIQIALNNVGRQLESGKLPANQANRYEHFLNIILSAYPFVDPEENTSIRFPVLFNDRWEMREYKFKKFNISPHEGPLSKVINEKDYIYSYALEPVKHNANPMLVFMGTTYPAGQGADLANLYNVMPLQSVGEGHDLTEVEAWLKNQKNVIVKGHSKGATMSMVTAAKYHEYILRADCFSPAPLSSATLSRLSLAWEALAVNERPEIVAYLQPGDPVSYIGRGFLKHTKVINIIPETDDSSVNIKLPGFLKNFFLPYERHIHYLLGRKNTIAIQGNVEQLNRSHLRVFVNDVKSVLDWVLFPFMYVDLFLRSLWNRIKPAIFDIEPNAYRLPVALLVFLGLVVVALSVVFPATPAIALWLGMTAAWVIPAIKVASLLVATAVATAAPFIIEYTPRVLFNIVSATVTVAALLLSSIGAGLKAGVKAIFSNKSEVEMTNIAGGSSRAISNIIDSDDVSAIPTQSSVLNHESEPLLPLAEASRIPKTALIGRLSFFAEAEQVAVNAKQPDESGYIYNLDGTY